jgi:CheY-like chemotaxis protein
MNLAVNARDAMPGGGRLSIETANVDLDDALLVDQCGPAPGRYIMLAVSDSGHGMDAETRRRIFEPFFTTKEMGRGTGLGLSTCYGIVKQSGGNILVYSEPGKGASFKIYLPRVEAEPVARAPQGEDKVDLQGEETVLMVEDDAEVRAAVARMLLLLGYKVLVASGATEAIELAKQHGGAVDLILCDVILPTSNGPEIVREVRKHVGDVAALFMSGYTDHAIFRSGALEPGMNFIQKPFNPLTLARKLRELLDVCPTE